MEHGQKLLIVEDDPGLAEMLAHYFRVQGFEVLITTLGENACSMAWEALPDLIVLDIHLPDISGYEVVHRLQESHRTRSIPVVFLTELTDRMDKRQGLELGVFDYITKPFDVQELRLRVRNTLHRASPRSGKHPITQLPEGEPVREALAGIKPDIGLLIAHVQGLNTFRELYGFVASDDVLRVISLMLRNAGTEIGGAGTFCGHIDDNALLIIAPYSSLTAIETRIRERAAESLEYFYPSDNRGAKARTKDRLRIGLGRIDHLDGPIVDLTVLKQMALPPV
jgi:CheY-like chemotaxis protein